MTVSPNTGCRTIPARFATLRCRLRKDHACSVIETLWQQFWRTSGIGSVTNCTTREADNTDTIAEGKAAFNSSSIR